MTQQIVYSVETLLNRHRQALSRVASAGRQAVRICRHENRRLKTIAQSLPSLAARKFRWERQRIEQWEKWLQAVSPEKVLRRGFACVYHQDRIVKDAADLRAGDTIRICFRQGEAGAEVTEIR